VVLRRLFPAHQILTALSGAAGANLLGIKPLFGLVSFAVMARFGIGVTSRRTEMIGDRPVAGV